VDAKGSPAKRPSVESDGAAEPVRPKASPVRGARLAQPDTVAIVDAAFFVTCDATNNPPETRMPGELYVDIGLAPVRPAEFVVIRITQKTAGPDSTGK
jgi:phage tail sheath protein FI